MQSSVEPHVLFVDGLAMFVSKQILIAKPYLAPILRSHRKLSNLCQRQPKLLSMKGISFNLAYVFSAFSSFTTSMYSWISLKSSIAVLAISKLVDGMYLHLMLQFSLALRGLDKFEKCEIYRVYLSQLLI